MSIGRFGHPSLRKLHRWVDGEPLPIDRHLATCEYCADRLEPMLEESDDTIRLALLEILAVPDQLPERIRTEIDKRLANQRDLALFGEFFVLPLRTARIISANDQWDD